MGMGNSSKQAYKAKIGQVLLYLIILYHISKQHSEQVQALMDLYLTFLLLVEVSHHVCKENFTDPQ